MIVEAHLIAYAAVLADRRGESGATLFLSEAHIIPAEFIFEERSLLAAHDARLMQKVRVSLAAPAEAVS